MGRNPNVGGQGFMEGSLTQKEPLVLWLSLIHSLGILSSSIFFAHFT